MTTVKVSVPHSLKIWTPWGDNLANMVLPDSWGDPCDILVIPDVFAQDINPQVTYDVLDIARQVSRHSYYFLTRVPHRMRDHLADLWTPDQFPHCYFCYLIDPAVPMDNFDYPMGLIKRAGYNTKVYRDQIIINPEEPSP